MRYRMNTPGVIHETLDGEAVIVNLLTGTYYSLDKAGGVIWELLISGMNSAEVVARLDTVFDADGSALADAVAELTAALVQEELIVQVKDDAVPAVATAAAGTRLPFEQPVLHRYTDMQELLLLDPIHEVDERGWPHTNTTAPTGQ